MDQERQDSTNGHSEEGKYLYRLTKIVLNDGKEFDPGNLTVIVGPNNSGKSRALKDILAITTRRPTDKKVVVVDATFALPENLNELRTAYDVERVLDQHNQGSISTISPTLCTAHRVTGGSSLDRYSGRFDSASESSLRAMFPEEFGVYLVAFLTTEDRLRLVKESQTANRGIEVSNLLQLLWNGRIALEKRIRSLTKDAFAVEIALHQPTPQIHTLCVGKDFSGLPPSERDARPILANHRRLDDEGDGIRAYVGILTAFATVRRPVWLVDEPEAFLHPPQAFRIGQFIADQAREDRQIILATHSADVLRGILMKDADVRIIRIDRTQNTNAFSVLDPGEVKELMTDPLLSSARVLDGVFYSGAVVVEGDRDARFYQSVSRKLRPDMDLHFVNADNKQTVPRVMKKYEDMGVHRAGIVDFDVLNDASEFRNQIQELGVANPDLDRAVRIRNEIAKAAKEAPPDEVLTALLDKLEELCGCVRSFVTKELSLATNRPEAVAGTLTLSQTGIELGKLIAICKPKQWRELKRRGRAALPEELRERFDELSRVCARHGLFINPRGELESMLVQHGIDYTNEKKDWFARAMRALRSLEANSSEYPWKLIDAVHDYMLSKESPPNNDGEASAE